MAVVLALVFLQGASAQDASAQDASAQDSAQAAVDRIERPLAETARDAGVPIDQLKVMLRPLVKDQLEVEADAWLKLLRLKIREVGDVELEIKALPEGDAGDQLKSDLVDLRQEENEIARRASVVLDSFENKGGDAKESRQFIDAVSDISETTDATTYWAAVKAEAIGWWKGDDGGKLLLRRGVTALVILFVFWLISKIAGGVTARLLARHPRASSLLENFVRRTTGGLVFMIGLLMALSVMGLEIAPMLAALGAGGFIVGFALQETLGSFASGMMIMVYRPFDVDDYVSVAGVEGTVKELSLVSTTLATVDNKVLVIPNKKAWGDTIVNFTGQDKRRVDLVFRIGYGDDLQKAMQLLRQVAEGHELVLNDPGVVVQVGELADSSVNLICRPWAKTKDYWTVYWDLTREVKLLLDAEGFHVPFPQRTVQILGGSQVGPA